MNKKKSCDNNMNLQFIEIYNLNKIKFLFNLSFKSFDEYFNIERNIETFEKYTYQDKKNYHNQVIKFLNELLVNIEDESSICKIDKKYKITSGRCYLKGFGIQKFQKEVRDFLFYDENCYDLDIVNCIPSILLYFAEKYNITTPQLKLYVENRTHILNEYGLTKNEIIINLNQDSSKTKNSFMRLLNDDFMKIKIFVKNNSEFNKYNCNIDSKNPLSSKLSKILYEYETEIIQKVIKIIPQENINGLTFDGFIYNGNNPEEILKNINLIVNDYKYIKFIIKPFDPFNNILDDFDNFIENGAECNHYSTKKIEFEKKFNYCLNFGIYLEKVDDIWVERQLDHLKMNAATIRHTQVIDGKVKEVSTFSIWKDDPNRLVFDNIIFEPYNEYDDLQKEKFNKKYENKRIINKFTGFNAKKIDLTEENIKKAQIFWDYLKETISYNNEEIYTHLKKFLAHIVQKPQELAEVINVFKSLEGIGKDTLVLILTKILGEKYIYSTEDQSEIFGSFNEIVENKLILVFNEAEGKSGYNNKERIKGLSTKKKNLIKKKYQNPIELTNLVRIFFFSNNANPVSLSSDSRRFCIINNNFNKIGDKQYFTDLYNKVVNDEDTINTIFTQLLVIDLKDYQPRFNKPITNEEVKMKLHNYNILHYYLYNIRHFLEETDFTKYKNDYIIQSTILQQNFINYLSEEGYDKKYIKNYNNFKRISNELLNDKLEGISVKSVKIDNKSKKYYYFDMNLFLPKIDMVFKNHITNKNNEYDNDLYKFLNNQNNEEDNDKNIYIESSESEFSDNDNSDSD